MSLISLLFKFTGDRTPLKQEAEKAKQDMSKAGSDIGKEFAGQLKGAIMSVVGISAVAATIKKAFSDAAKGEIAAASAGGAAGGIRENIAMERAMQATGLSREQIQATAQQNPEQFSAFIKRFEPGASEADLRNVAAAKASGEQVMSMFGDTLASKVAGAGNRIVSPFEMLGGLLSGNTGQMKSGLVRMITGSEPGAGGESQQAAFVRLNAAREASDREFAELVDATNRQIEETRKVREAIERN